MSIKLHGLSVRTRFILSFALIVFISVLVFNVTFFALVERNYTAEIDRSNRRALEILVASLEKQWLEPAIVYASEMAVNGTVFPDLHRLMHKPEEMDAVEIFRVHGVLKGFSYNHMGLFSDVMVYSSQLNLAVANTNGVIYFEQPGTKSEGALWWVEAAFAQGGSSAWLYGNINPSLDQSGLIYVGLFALPNGNGRIGFAFQFARASLDALIQGHSQAETSYYLFGPNGAMLYGDPDAFEALPDQAALAAALQAPEQFVDSLRLDRGKTSLNVAAIPLSGLTLLSLTPTDFLYRQANTLGWILRSIGFLTFLAGLVLSYFLTNRLYRPLKAIRSVASLPPAEEEASLNDYEYIDSVLKRLKDRSAHLEQLVSENMPVLRSLRLQTLLDEGPLERDMDLGQYRHIGLSLDMPYFRILRVLLPEALAEALSEKDLESVLYSLMDRVERLSDPRQYCLYCLKNHARGFTVLVNQHAGGVDGDLQLRGLCEAVIAYARTAYTVRAACLVSSVVRKPDLLYQLGAELDELQHYQFYLWTQNPLFASGVPALGGGTRDVPEALLAETYRQAESSDPAAAEKAVADLLEAFATGNYPYDQCRAHIQVLLKRVAAMHPDQPQLYDEAYEAFVQCENADGLRVLVRSMLTSRTTQHMSTQEGKGTLLVQRAVEYIQENGHKGLGVEEIARHLRVSAGHLSRLFREEQGVSPSEFINARRLERSLALLEDTDLRIEEIAVRVGYGSTAYYIKKFREQYGITPKAHRMRHVLREQGLPEFPA